MSYVGWAILTRDPEVSRLRATVEYLRFVEDDQLLGGEFVFGIDTRTPQSTVDLIAGWPGAKIVPIEWNDNFSDARNTVIAAVESPWTFQIDPDELPNHGLLWEIHEIVRQNPEKPIGYVIDFRNFFGATNLREPHFDSDWHLRFWKTGRGRYYRPIHELVELDGMPESDSRARPDMVREIPKSRFVIHAKPPVLIDADDRWYAELERKVGQS